MQTSGNQSDDVRFWKMVNDAGGAVPMERYLKSSKSARMARRIFWSFIDTVFSKRFKINVSGLENLPEPPFLLTPNHTSHLDTLVLYHALDSLRDKLAVMAARDYFFKNKIVGRFAQAVLSAIPVGRSGDFFDGLFVAKNLIERGRIVVLFPEGTRSVSGRLQPFKPGIGLLVSMLDMPVIPVKIEGAYELWPKGANLPHGGAISLRFGPQYRWPEECPRRKFDFAVFQKVADDLHRVIAET